MDALYLNKIYPEEALEGYFSDWKEHQEASLKLAHESFKTQKIFKLELQEDEICGKEALDKIGDILYADCDPTEIFSRTESFTIEDKNGTRTLIMELPFVKSKDEISVIKDGNDIVISWLNEARRFHLPEKLRRRDISGYEYENGYLRIKMDY